jgi:large subunit ribosomal protein L24
VKLKKEDMVLVIAGKDRGRTAKIIKAFPRKMQILVEGINIKNKHVRPKKQGEKGQMVKIPTPINVSNVKFLCPKCKKASRLSYSIGGAEKLRICKKCKSEV